LVDVQSTVNPALLLSVLKVLGSRRTQNCRWLWFRYIFKYICFCYISPYFITSHLL